jgi:hypothetical protein
MMEINNQDSKDLQRKDQLSTDEPQDLNPGVSDHCKKMMAQLLEIAPVKLEDLPIQRAFSESSMVQWMFATLSKMVATLVKAKLNTDVIVSWLRRTLSALPVDAGVLMNKLLSSLLEILKTVIVPAKMTEEIFVVATRLAAVLPVTETLRTVASALIPLLTLVVL